MQKTAQNIRRTGLPLRSHLQAGNAASDACYADRNLQNLVAPLTGNWYPENQLKNCLSQSGEPLWWKDFPGMDQEQACEVTKRYWTYDRDIVKAMGC